MDINGLVRSWLLAAGVVMLMPCAVQAQTKSAQPSCQARFENLRTIRATVKNPQIFPRVAEDLAAYERQLFAEYDKGMAGKAAGKRASESPELLKGAVQGRDAMADFQRKEDAKSSTDFTRFNIARNELDACIFRARLARIESAAKQVAAPKPKEQVTAGQLDQAALNRLSWDELTDIYQRVIGAPKPDLEYARRIVQTALRRFPDHPNAAGARSTLAQIERQIAATAPSFAPPPAPAQAAVAAPAAICPAVVPRWGYDEHNLNTIREIAGKNNEHDVIHSAVIMGFCIEFADYLPILEDYIARNLGSNLGKHNARERLAEINRELSKPDGERHFGSPEKGRLFDAVYSVVPTNRFAAAKRSLSASTALPSPESQKATNASVQSGSGAIASVPPDEPLPSGPIGPTDQASLNRMKADDLFLLARRVERQGAGDVVRGDLRRILQTIVKLFPGHPLAAEIREALALTENPGGPAEQAAAAARAEAQLQPVSAPQSGSSGLPAHWSEQKKSDAQFLSDRKTYDNDYVVIFAAIQQGYSIPEDVYKRLMEEFVKAHPNHRRVDTIRGILQMIATGRWGGGQLAAKNPKGPALEFVLEAFPANTVAARYLGRAPTQPAASPRGIDPDDVNWLRGTKVGNDPYLQINAAVARGYYLPQDIYKAILQELLQRFPNHQAVALAKDFIRRISSGEQISDTSSKRQRGSAFDLVLAAFPSNEVAARYRSGMSGAASGSQAAGSAPSSSSGRPPKVHDPAGVAHDCLSINPGGLYGGFVNRCDFPINFHYCAIKPTKESWLGLYDCHKKGGGSWQVGARARAGVHTRGAAGITWFACRRETHSVYEVHFNFETGRMHGQCIRN